ncbi:MAG: hypothetical protein J7623_22720 [Chitinophaga sp.]|uniref:hypothetical protein n=1 Tax=Chitinophaga sp. TaxID=1869181 RepID=UPI001B0FA870|nr:hypothetical protein [Chitinophaga sp.]MBO9731472.1 hypothetical protein [Chitinophaga sp.]
MNIILLYFIIQSGAATQDKLYFYTATECSMWYAVKTEWGLNLKEHGTFILKFTKKDTRFQKETKSDFLGTWQNKNDTIILTVSAPLPNDCGIKTANYVLSGDKLKSLMMYNLCLPSVLAPIKNEQY